MIKGNTILIQKGTAFNYYRPITCLLIMWKIRMEQTKEEIYYSLISCRLFPEVRKDAASGPDEQDIYYTLINTSSRIVKRDAEIFLWCWSIIKSIWYGPAKLSQNVLDITQSHKVHRGNHEKLESGNDNWSKKLNWGKNPERYIPGRWTITITICDSDNAIQSLTWEMHRRIQTINRKKRLTT